MNLTNCPPTSRFFFVFFVVFLFSIVGSYSQNIDTANTTVVIRSITFTGNKVTKAHIIRRELTFSEGDTLPFIQFLAEQENSKLNLRNMALFHFVTFYDRFDSLQTDSAIRQVDVTIDFMEEWYTWPAPIFELADRNFNVWWKTKDFSRTNYGLYVIRENFRGRKENLSFKFRWGYSQQFGINYVIPGINKKQTNGLSFYFAYSRNKEIIYGTANNKTEFYKDGENFIRKEYSAYIQYTFRKAIHNSHLAQFKYNFSEVGDTVIRLNPTYFMHGENTLSFFTLSYLFKHDYRDIQSYPLHGYYFDIGINKPGLGILKDEKLNVLYLQTSYKHFWRLGGRFYSAASAKVKLSTDGFQPYYLEKGFGYSSDFVRGYEYYVVDGQNFVLLKTNVKYELVKPQVYQMKFLKSTKFNTFHYAFYLNLFADGGYVYNRYRSTLNDLPNTFLPSIGIGLDYVTYYDAVLRMEYSFNKFGESGIFIHFVAPI